METLKALFGEWLPDLPDLDNPGLTEANNVIPSDGCYAPFKPLSISASAVALTGVALAGVIPYNAANGFLQAYIATPSEIYRSSGNSPAGSADVGWTLISTTGTASARSFVQFDNLLVAAGATVQAITVGAVAASNLATSGTTPEGSVCGVIGRFVLVGNLNDGTAERWSKVRWSAIDDPRNWPIPGTSTAAAAQAGEQILPLALGSVTGIFGTDKYGIVLQNGGITRMQYIGGSIVFQFDTVDSVVGCPYPHGSIMVDGIVYFFSGSDFFATDGITIKSIMGGKVAKHFIADFFRYPSAAGAGGKLFCAYDRNYDVIYWAYADENVPTTGVGSGAQNTNKLVLYHRASGRWAGADAEIRLLINLKSGNASMDSTTSGSTDAPIDPEIYAFSLSNTFGRFDGTPGTATFVTSESELIPGRYSHVSGVKPLIEYATAAPTVSVAIGSRNDLSDSSLTYSGTTTPTTDTGFADFRDSARYHRAKIQVTGDFRKAFGLEWKVTPEGER